MGVNIKDLDISKLSPQWQAAIEEFLGGKRPILVEMDDWLKSVDRTVLDLYAQFNNHEIEPDELFTKLGRIEMLTSEYILTKAVEKLNGGK